MITIDWQNKIVESTASILDLPVFHAALRDLEDSEAGAIHDVTHTWKALDLGGSYFYQADLANGYTLKFIGVGPFQISGNLNGSIVDTGVQVERKTSAAYATTSVGGSGSVLNVAEITDAVIAALQANTITTNGNWPTALQNASAVVAAINSNTPSVNVSKVRGKTLTGDGIRENPWGPI